MSASHLLASATAAYFAASLLLVSDLRIEGKQLNPEAKRLLTRVLQDAGLDRARVTRVGRSSRAQATAMFDHIRANGLTSSYELYGRSGDRVIDVYEEHEDGIRNGTMSKRTAISHMARSAEQELERLDLNVSTKTQLLHASDIFHVVDIHPESIENVDHLRDALDAHKYVARYLMPTRKHDAIHVEFWKLPSSAPDDGSHFEYQALGRVPFIDQTGMTCWAASAAIMLSWKESNSVAPREAAHRGGLGALYDAGAIIPFHREAAFYERLGLVLDSPNCYTPRGIHDLLEQHGPILVQVESNAETLLTHFVVVHGIRGDGGPDTLLSIMDPLDGPRPQVRFSDFIESLEGVADEALRCRIPFEIMQVAFFP